MQSQRYAYLSIENFVSSTRWRQSRFHTSRISAAVHRKHITHCIGQYCGCSYGSYEREKSKSPPKRMRPTPFVLGQNLHHISNQLCHSLKNDKANLALDFQGEKMKPQRRAYLSSENFVSSARWRRFQFHTFHISATASPRHRKHGYCKDDRRFYASAKLRRISAPKYHPNTSTFSSLLHRHQFYPFHINTQSNAGIDSMCTRCTILTIPH